MTGGVCVHHRRRCWTARAPCLSRGMDVFETCVTVTETASPRDLQVLKRQEPCLLSPRLYSLWRALCSLPHIGPQAPCASAHRPVHPLQYRGFAHCIRTGNDGQGNVDTDQDISLGAGLRSPEQDGFDMKQYRLVHTRIASHSSGSRRTRQDPLYCLGPYCSTQDQLPSQDLLSSVHLRTTES